MKHFRFAALAGALALSVLTHGATAQQSAATAQPAAASAPARAPLDLFVGYDTFRSPDISPNGRYVAAVHREAIGDVLTILDLDTRRISRVSVARADQQMQIENVAFKSDNRLVFVIVQKVHVVGARTSMFRTEIVDDAWEYDSRIYSSNIDGSDARPLYDPSTQQGYPRWLSARIVDLMDSDPDNILLVAPYEGGTQLWRVNVRTAQHTVVDQGTWFTFDYVVDNQGAQCCALTGTQMAAVTCG